MISSMFKELIVLFLLVCFATPAMPVTAKISGQVNACIYDGDSSCYGGPILIKMGVYDFTPFLAQLRDPMDGAAEWPDSLPWLDPSFNDFLFSETLTIQGADMKTVPSGTPYEIDISRLVEWCQVNNASEKPLGFIFLTLGGTGKINLFSDETFVFNTPSQLVGVSVRNDGENDKIFRFNPQCSNFITGAIQYTGHCRQNLLYKDACFVIGGHQRLYPGDRIIDKDRCAFFFHRGLAQYLGWKGANYDLGPTTEISRTGISSVLLPFEVAQNNPNPFNRLTRISYSLASGGISAPVRIIIRDVRGQSVYESYSYEQSGSHDFLWDASGLSNGTYFLNVSSGKDYSQTRKMIFIK